MRFVRSFGALALLAGLAACTQFPELEARRTPGVEDAPFPRLLPLDTLLAGPEATASPEVIASVSARADGLRSRAARLRAARVAAPLDASARAAGLRQRAADLRRQ